MSAYPTGWYEDAGVSEVSGFIEIDRDALENTRAIIESMSQRADEVPRSSPDIEPDVEEALREMERDHDDWPERSDYDPNGDGADQ